MAADLARDVIRKGKVYIALGLLPRSLADARGVRPVGPEGVGPEGGPAGKRQRLQQSQWWQEGPVRFGTAQHGQDPMRTLLRDVDAAVPTLDELPQSALGTFRFADRLGVYLTHGEVRLIGSYPGPDGNIVLLHNRAEISTPQGRAIIRADTSFHGRQTYSFVEVRGGDGTLWYGQVLLLCSFQYEENPQHIALVSYLDEDESMNALLPCKKSFHWFSQFPDCVDLSHVVRPVRMLHVPHASRGEVKFVMVHEEVE